MKYSIIIPTYNGSTRISNCLDALAQQVDAPDVEIVVVNDGSTDDTLEVLSRYSEVVIFTQKNAGPAAARNQGAQIASGDIIFFTDDDCVPEPDWLAQMARPFEDNPDVGGIRGSYLCKQPELVARFVQLEYEDKYRLLSRDKYIDFIDTYSAGFRRDIFLEFGGYDTSFPVACAEDIELSYRMSAANVKMLYQPKAYVYHTHPNSLLDYAKKKYKFAFWRMLALRKNPQKIVRDSHTPQLMKLQILFAPAIFLALLTSTVIPMFAYVAIGLLLSFVVTTIPFCVRAWKTDPAVAVLSPMILAVRASSQFLGVIRGTLNLLR